MADKIHKIPLNKRWWCNSRERQSRYHLSFRCKAWALRSEDMWGSIGKACGWRPEGPSGSVRLLFQDERVTTAVGDLASLAPLEVEEGGGGLGGG